MQRQETGDTYNTAYDSDNDGIDEEWSSSSYSRSEKQRISLFSIKNSTCGNFCKVSTHFSGEKTTLLSGGSLYSLMIPIFMTQK